MTPIHSPFTTSVVGVTFVPGYPRNIYTLEELVWAKSLNAMGSDEMPVALLVRTPDNKHDPNAIQIHVPALGDEAYVGHLPAALAARIAPELDAGAEWQGWITAVKIASEHEDRPGLSIELRRVQKQ